MKFNIREQDKKKRPRLDSGQIGTEHEPTMEELMRMNPFIQMRMRAFRQRKFAKEHMNSAIKEED